MQTDPRTGYQPEADGADALLDCTGLVCPLPVYKTSQILARLRPGQTLALTCTDPASMADIPALARRGGHELLWARDGGAVQEFLLRKGAAGGA